MKYIDSEKLKAEIERRIKSVESCPFIEAEFGAEMRREGKIQTYNEILSFIDSLQQEQPESVKGKFMFPKFLYARTLDNKTIDVAYGPQSLNTVEYIRKNALIEWAKEMKRICRGAKPIEKAYQTMIDKIESL